MVLNTRVALIVCAALLAIILTCYSHVPSAGPEKNPDSTVEPNDANKPETSMKPENKEKRQHSAFRAYVSERKRMVSTQIKARGIRDPQVLNALETVPRHAFIPSNLQTRAHADGPLPIAHGQTISQPYIVAFMTEALALEPNDRVLEIGTGSGYQAAVCAEIAQHVYTIEIIEGLAETATKRLQELGYKNITVKAGDGFYGWPEQAPFDAIIGTAAAGRIPPPLLEQLKPGARMIIPKETRMGFQSLILITKDAEGKIVQKNVLPVRFVPMTGQVKKPAK